MNGSTHVDIFLPIVAAFFRTVRLLLKLGAEDWLVFIEDLCPAHCGDKCKDTGREGLLAARRQFFLEHRVSSVSAGAAPCRSLARRASSRLGSG